MFKKVIRLRWKIGFDNLSKREFYKMQQIIQNRCKVLRILTREAKPQDTCYSDVFVVKGTEKEMKNLIHKIETVKFVKNRDWAIEPYK